MLKKPLIINCCLLAVILIIASFPRLYNLTSVNNAMAPPGLYPDEAMNGNNAVEAWESRDWSVFYPENFGREGLYMNIQSLSAGMFGNEPWALRLPSAIFGILTVLGLYFLTFQLFKDKRLALLATLLLATSFWHINFSRIGFRAIMAPTFLVWSLYLLLKASQTKNNSQLSILNYQNWELEIGNWKLPALAGALYGLGFHSYIAYRATPLLVLFIMFFIWRAANLAQRKNLFKIFSVFILFAFLSVLPLGIHFFKNPADFFGRTTGISVFVSESPLRDLALNTAKTLGMFNLFGDFNWRHNIAGNPLLFWPVGIMFLVGIFMAIRLKIDNWKLKILLVWLIIAALPVIVSNEGLPHALRSILMAPPVFILAAIGGVKIYEFLKLYVKSKTIIHASLFIILSLLVFESYHSYFIVWNQNPNVKNAFAYNDYIISRQLNELPQNMPKYIVVSGADRKIERDYPIHLQSILFLTDTFTNEKRADKNFYYLTPQEFEKTKIPPGSKIINL